MKKINVIAIATFALLLQALPAFADEGRNHGYRNRHEAFQPSHLQNARTHEFHESRWHHPRKHFFRRGCFSHRNVICTRGSHRIFA